MEKFQWKESKNPKDPKEFALQNPELRNIFYKLTADFDYLPFIKSGKMFVST
jgi:hypothetical protein